MPVMEDQQLEQHKAELAAKDSIITNQADQIKSLGAFKQEALNGRDTIVSLNSKVSGLEQQLTAVTKQAASSASNAQNAATHSATSAKKVAAAEDLAKAIKVLLGL